MTEAEQTTPRAAFRDIKATILSRILSGQWPPGSFLPGEVELAAEFHCARATVNRAMRELAEDGIIERKRKAGTRVCKSPVRQARFEIPVVRDEIEQRGGRYRYALVSRAEVPAPQWLRARLSLEEESRALHLICLHHSDGAPYQYEDRWINLASLPQARGVDFTAVGPNEWLVDTVPFSDAEISFSATSAGHEAASLLGCRAQDALFQVERTTWWQGQALTHVRLLHRPGHRMTTRY